MGGTQRNRLHGRGDRDEHHRQASDLRSHRRTGSGACIERNMGAIMITAKPELQPARLQRK